MQMQNSTLPSARQAAKLANQGNRELNFLDFAGVTMKGDHDDTSAWAMMLSQAASEVDSGATKPLKIVLPAGIINLTAPGVISLPSYNPAVSLDLAAGLTIQGAGPYSTMIKSTYTGFILPIAKGMITLDGFTIFPDFLGDGIQLGGIEGADVSVSEVVTQSWLRNIRVLAAKTRGLQVKFCFDSSFDNILISEMGDNGIALDIPVNTTDSCNNLDFNRFMSETDAASGVTHVNIQAGTSDPGQIHHKITFRGAHLEGNASHTYINNVATNGVVFERSTIIQKVIGGTGEEDADVKNAIVLDDCANFHFLGGDVLILGAVSPAHKLLALKNGANGFLFDRTFFSPEGPGQIPDLYDLTSFDDPDFETSELRNIRIFDWSNPAVSSKQWIGDTPNRFVFEPTLTDGGFAALKLRQSEQQTVPNPGIDFPDVASISVTGGFCSQKPIVVPQASQVNFHIETSETYGHNAVGLFISAIGAGAYGAIVTVYDNVVYAVSLGANVEINVSALPAPGNVAINAFSSTVYLINNTGADITFFWHMIAPSD